mmetsp:Transcript_52319/g.124610  ORF Transcript_52319/g.124610 Transcript_52319/m.124610 type:complete len:250 (-) Transcript_52319:67-816(-)
MADKAQEIFRKYDTSGTGFVDAWDVKLALKEMGKEMTDPMIFEMLRHNDKEVATVTLEKFLVMCDTDVSQDGMSKRSTFKNQVEFQSAWEAVGGKKDLSGEVDGKAIKVLFETFELVTSVDKLLAGEKQTVDFSAFCSLLEPKDPAPSVRRICAEDMRRPFSNHGRPLEVIAIQERLRSQRELKASAGSGRASVRRGDSLNGAATSPRRASRVASNENAPGSPKPAKSTAAPGSPRPAKSTVATVREDV